MNVSMNDIAYDVIEMYKATYKDTDSLDVRQVYHWVNVARSFIIKQRLEKNIFNIYEEEIQQIKGIVLGAVTGSTGVVGSSSAIPSTIPRTGYQGTITRVSYPYSGTSLLTFNPYPVQIVTQKRFQRVGNRKFNGSLFYATIGMDKKLYFKTYTLTGIDRIMVEGVFQNPIEVMLFNSETDPYNAAYPLNSNLIKDVTNLIVSEKFQFILQQTEDKVPEDGRDSTTK